MISLCGVSVGGVCVRKFRGVDYFVFLLVVLSVYSWWLCLLMQIVDLLVESIGLVSMFVLIVLLVYLWMSCLVWYFSLISFVVGLFGCQMLIIIVLLNDENVGVVVIGQFGWVGVQLVSLCVVLVGLMLFIRFIGLLIIMLWWVLNISSCFRCVFMSRWLCFRNCGVDGILIMGWCQCVYWVGGKEIIVFGWLMQRLLKLLNNGLVKLLFWISCIYQCCWLLLLFCYFISEYLVGVCLFNVRYLCVFRVGLVVKFFLIECVYCSVRLVVLFVVVQLLLVVLLYCVGQFCVGVVFIYELVFL